MLKVAGWNMAVAIVMLLLALTSFAVVVRAYESGEDDIEQYNHNAADFRYLYGYLIELAVSLFLFTPLIEIVLFTGVLGCCAVP